MKSEVQFSEFDLTDLQNVNKTGYTGFRMGVYDVHFTSTSSDGGCSINYYSAADSGKQPTLTVYYSSAPRKASKLMFVAEQ